MRIKGLLAFVFYLFSASSFAVLSQPVVKKNIFGSSASSYVPPVENTETAAKKGDFNITGYIDGSYNYMMKSNKFTSGVYDRVYDLATSGFSLQQADVKLAYQPPTGFGAMTNLIVGRDAIQIAPAGFNAKAFNSKNFGFVTPETYVQYVKNNYTFMLGEFYSLSGIEEIAYPQNINFSRSILFGYAESGSAIGVGVADKMSDKLTLTAKLLNGWSTIKQPQKLQAAEFNINYAATDAFSVSTDLYTGKNYLTDIADSGPSGWRNLFDIYASYKWNPQLTFSVNGDYGMQTKAPLTNGLNGRVTWEGIAGYVNYFLNENWRLAARMEMFDDLSGYRTGVSQNWREMTLTVGYYIIKHLQVFGEARYDISNATAFQNKTGFGLGTSNRSYALNVLYDFDL